jgi:hypothetical protein
MRIGRVKQAKINRDREWWSDELISNNERERTMYSARHGGYRTNRPCQLVSRTFDGTSFGESENVRDTDCDLGDLDDFVESLADGEGQDAAGHAPESDVVAARDFTDSLGNDCRAYLVRNIEIDDE